jgi:flagellar protein FlaG
MVDSIRLTASESLRPQMITAAATPHAQTIESVAEKAPVEQKKATANPKIDPQKMMDTMREVVERLNQQMKDNNRNLGFSIDRAINTFVVTVTDSNTGEVIRQIPTEVVVKSAHSIEDMKGILFNETQ